MALPQSGSGSISEHFSAQNPSGEAGSGRNPSVKLPRTSVLVSVQNARELDALVDLEIAWIDLKRPSHGSLGCPTPEEIDQFVAGFRRLPPSVSGARCSLAVGDLEERAELGVRAEQLQEFSILKVGIRELGNLEGNLAKLRTWREASGFSDRWAITYYADLNGADLTRWEVFIDLAVRERVSQVLIDTSLKNGLSTLGYLPLDLLKSMIASAADREIDVMVAGSLRLVDLAPVWNCGAKIVGVRSAVCEKNMRTNALDTGKLRELAEFWL